MSASIYQMSNIVLISSKNCRFRIGVGVATGDMTRHAFRVVGSKAKNVSPSNLHQIEQCVQKIFCSSAEHFVDRVFRPLYSKSSTIWFCHAWGIVCHGWFQIIAGSGLTTRRNNFQQCTSSFRWSLWYSPENHRCSYIIKKWVPLKLFCQKKNLFANIPAAANVNRW